MKNIRSFCCLLVVLLLAVPQLRADGGEDFDEFLRRFTTSAGFQYSRVKFPLKTPITLIEEDGETERTFPFTREKWHLIDVETLTPGVIKEEDQPDYISRFTTSTPTLREFVAGYAENEPSLRLVFEQIDGKWYVTDGYTDWYNFDLLIEELEETIQTVQEENKAFEEEMP